MSDSLTAKQRRTIRSAARRGAEFLDKHQPGWFRKIKSRKIKMARPFIDSEGCGCVLAQLDGSYFRRRGRLGIRGYAESVRLGFDTEWSPRGYEELDAAWRDEVRLRRTAPKGVAQ